MVDDIIFQSGIKRKALCVIRTRCRYCKKPWLDKYYDKPVHRVICPHCNMINAKIQFDDMIDLLLMGAKYDIGRNGIHGGMHMPINEIKKLVIKKYGTEEGERIFANLLKK